MNKELILKQVSSMNHDEKMEYIKTIFDTIENLNCASRHSSDFDGGYNAIVLFSNGKEILEYKTDEWVNE